MDAAIEEFYELAPAGKRLAKKAAGMLVFPNVKKAGLAVGGEYGEEPLESFRKSKGWEVGVDGSVAIANIGAGGEIETKSINQPIVAFIFGNKGLMYNLSLEGSKLSKIDK